MATAQLTFKNSDGAFTEQMDPAAISWGPYSMGGKGSKKLNRSDIGSLMTDVIGMDGEARDFLVYNDADQNWVVNKHPFITDSYGYNLVLSSEGVYVATDTQLEKIPNFTTRTLYITRIKESVTLNNVDSYQSLSDSAGNYRCIPLGLTMTQFTGFTYIYGLNHYTDGTGANSLAFYNGLTTDNGNLNHYNSGGKPFPQVTHYWKAANTEIQDLETNVALLQQSVKDIEQRLAKVEKTVGDLPAIVAAVSSNVSKNYVAR